MTNGITLRSVEKLVQQLPLAKQTELVNRLSQQLSARPIEALSKTAKQTKQQLEEERRVRAEKLIAEMDAVAEKFPGKSNVVAEIRRLRKKRTRQIWKNVSTPV